MNKILEYVKNTFADINTINIVSILLTLIAVFFLYVATLSEQYFIMSVIVNICIFFAMMVLTAINDSFIV